MQHSERRQLIAGISEIADELYRGEQVADRTSHDRRNRGELLRQRIEPLLDDFLLESQPIVETDVTVVLADIRGFTELTRCVPPQTLIGLLNRFFAAMCRVVKRQGGVIDKFMGDSVMALFGAPRARPDDLQRGLECAVEMQLAMTAFNRHSQGRGEPRLYAGIAVTSGPVMAGSFGSNEHSEYTVIGEAVNLASRIESFALRGQVLLGESSHAAARHLIETGRVNQVHVKGMAEPLGLYELRAVNGRHRLVIPRVDPRASPRISVDLDAIFRRIEAKQVRPDQFVGHVKDMGYFGMRADLPQGLAPHSEVVVNLHTDAVRSADQDLYARVLRTVPKGPSFRTSLEFTSIDTPGHHRIKRYVDERLWRR